ncbi:GntR family transcriptional regulator [Paenirhodobacter sp.]|uniref:GntR family transcriptional regulator n=1 Tax=Paenirhodobacter sp. TaxID=1965326 RepID=UPI003B40A877
MWLRQDHIAAEFGASHVPVRDAFRQIEAQRLAVSEPRRGVRVTSLDMAEMCAALETLALRHAAPNLTPDMLAEADRATRTAEQPATCGKANRLFHRTLLAPCVMTQLMASIDDLHAAIARFLVAAWRSVRSC